jgi:phage shock protein C
MQKKLVKSRTDRKICGVCGGLAEYINLDPTVIRILWLIFAFTGVGIFAYIACAFVMPD